MEPMKLHLAPIGRDDLSTVQEAGGDGVWKPSLPLRHLQVNTMFCAIYTIQNIGSKVKGLFRIGRKWILRIRFMLYSFGWSLNYGSLDWIEGPSRIALYSRTRRCDADRL